MKEFSVEEVRPGLFCIHSQLNAGKHYSQDDLMHKKEEVENNTFGLSTTNSAVAGFSFGPPIPKPTGKLDDISNLSRPSMNDLR